MPSRNRVKIYAPEHYYHLYNRGVNKRPIFKDEGDYAVFLNLLKRYLSGKKEVDSLGRLYDDLTKELELLAYCLMPNHFHLLVWQHKDHGMTKLMRRVMTSYTTYFNRKYGRTGPLFQDRFKASLISNEPYLWHISRYIHLNPADALNYDFSSLANYLGKRSSKWLKPARVLDMHAEYRGTYKDFLTDVKGYKDTLPLVQTELADS